MKSLFVAVATLLVVLGTAVAATSYGLGESPARANPTLVLGIDMDPTGNVCTGLADAGETCAIPSVEQCISIGSTDEGTAFEIDTFVTGLPNGFSRFHYDLYFPDTSTGANLAMTGQTETSAAANLVAQAAGSGVPMYAILSDPVPDTTSPHLSSVGDFGTFEDTSWTLGVLNRHEFTIQAGGATPGVYGFTFVPATWVILDQSNYTYTVDEVWDNNFSPQYGILALGVPCEVSSSVGGIAQYPDPNESALVTTDSSGGSSSPPYAALLGGGIAAAALTLTASAWYARRRWLIGR